jgi:hypothetical protein
MDWGTVLAVIVSFCSTYTGGNPGHNGCRHERVDCMKKAVAVFPNGNNAVELMDACLSDPHGFDHAVAPKPSSSPSVQMTPVPSASPSK